MHSPVDSEMEIAEMADNETPLTIPALQWWPQDEIQNKLKISVDDEDEGGDDDGDEDESEGDNDESEGDSDDDLDGMSEEDLRTNLKAARANIAKVNGESARHRSKRNSYKSRVAELEAELAKKGKSKKDDDDEDEDAPDKTAIESAAKARADERVIKAEAKTALVRAGLDADGPEGKKRLTKALRLLDISDVEVDEDDEVDGLDDALDELKAEFPELFRRSRKRRNINGNDGDDRPKKPMSASERQAAQLKGGKR